MNSLLFQLKKLSMRFFVLLIAFFIRNQIVLMKLENDDRMLPYMFILE